MMPELLLNELEQTAKESGVRVALMSAYQAGQADALNRQPVLPPTQDTREICGETDGMGYICNLPNGHEGRHEAYAGPEDLCKFWDDAKFKPQMYDSDWITEEGD